MMKKKHIFLSHYMFCFLFAVPLIIAFFVSMAVGLVLGAVVYVILTWMSRHKAGSARITRCPPHQSRSLRNRPGFNRSRSYDFHGDNTLVGATFMLRHQTSSPDHFETNHKSSFRGSTFHPLLQGSQTTGEEHEGSQTCLSTTPTLAMSAGPVQTRAHQATTPPRPVSFWGDNGLHTQSAPPAYERILRAYDETCTWVEEDV